MPKNDTIVTVFSNFSSSKSLTVLANRVRRVNCESGHTIACLTHGVDFMPTFDCTKGQAQVPSSSALRREETRTETPLDRYRAKSAAMVHKATGDTEQVCKEGLAVFEALSHARERANKTAKDE